MCAEPITGFIHFVGVEEQNVLTNIANLGDDFFLIHNLDILYLACTKLKPIDDIKLRLPVFLYLIVHSEFCFAMISFLRRHKSKSFVSLRVALDSTFTAYYLLKHPDKEEVYLMGEENKEWWGIFGKIKKTIKNNVKEFPLAKDLTEYHEICSAYAHSDALGIMHKFSMDKEKSRLEAKYFDYEASSEEYKKSLAILLVPFFNIFLIFWKEIFMHIAGEKKEELERNVAEFAEKLIGFSQKYTL